MSSPPGPLTLSSSIRGMTRTATVTENNNSDEPMMQLLGDVNASGSLILAAATIPVQEAARARAIMTGVSCPEGPLKIAISP